MAGMFPSDSAAERRAIVIGGSLAGMAAARVLSDHFEQVVIVDRDHFPATAQPRKGIPQARHIHVLLARGQRILFRLFPELEALLIAAGATPFDWAADTLVYGLAGYVPRFRSGLTSYGITRDRLEHAVRTCLLRTPSIHVMEGYEVVGFESASHGGVVHGARLRARGAAGSTATISAALTVDASGRESHAREWLAELGYPPARETIINSFFGYASALLRLAPGTDPPWKLALVRSGYPDTRGAVMMAVEDGLWQLTLGGAARDYPPTDEAGFAAFAASLPTPHIAAALRDGALVTPIKGFRRMENRRRHYERMSRWPEGFAATGDAVCAFNPVYGQGMTTAALGAEVLAGCLQDARRRGAAPASVTRRFQRALAAAHDSAWLMATSEDYRYPQTEGGRRDWTTRLAHWYFDRVLFSAARHADIHLAVVELTHMVQPPAILLRPSIMWRALTQRQPPVRRGTAEA